MFPLVRVECVWAAGDDLQSARVFPAPVLPPFSCPRLRQVKGASIVSRHVVLLFFVQAPFAGAELARVRRCLRARDVGLRLHVRGLHDVRVGVRGFSRSMSQSTRNKSPFFTWGLGTLHWALCTGHWALGNMMPHRAANYHEIDQVAEWLRRWTANPLCYACASSNLVLIASFFATTCVQPHALPCRTIT